MFWYDPSFLILIPAFFLTLWAQISVQSTFNTYSRKRSALGETGAAFARRLLDSAGLYDVKVEFVNGFLSDHYDPSSKVLRLSKSTYGSYLWRLWV
ncbi:MAG TPA: zinc metallopeptidase [Petrotogaceae bacterium]|nr:zinc metallopeptidase [Petrotogaceae bacterium]